MGDVCRPWPYQRWQLTLQYDYQLSGQYTTELRISSAEQCSRSVCRHNSKGTRTHTHRKRYEQRLGARVADVLMCLISMLFLRPRGVIIFPLRYLRRTSTRICLASFFVVFLGHGLPLTNVLFISLMDGLYMVVLLVAVLGLIVIVRNINWMETSM